MSFLKHLFVWTRTQAYEQIIKQYEDHWSCVVSFLYFANCMKWNLLEDSDDPVGQSYKTALETSDILLPDGIALQLFYRRGAVGRASGTMPHNLNGSDFNPWLLAKLCQQKNVHLGIYTVYDPSIGKPKSQIDTADQAMQEKFWQGFDFIYQVDYKDRLDAQFPRDDYERSRKEKNAEINLLLMSTGTPAQEVWTLKNREKITKNEILVINAWGTIDYISGFEKRAPKRVVKARVLETPWRIMQHPKKNLKKFLVMFRVFPYWWRSFMRRIGLSK